MSDHSSSPQDEIDQILAEVEAAHQATEKLLAESQVAIAAAEAENVVTQKKLDDEIVAEVDVVEQSGMKLLDDTEQLDEEGLKVSGV